MTDQENRSNTGPKPRTIRLPGFLIEGGDVGLGDTISRVSQVFGITPCGSCKRRATALNRWVHLAPRKSFRSSLPPA